MTISSRSYNQITEIPELLRFNVIDRNAPESLSNNYISREDQSKLRDLQNLRWDMLFNLVMTNKNCNIRSLWACYWNKIETLSVQIASFSNLAFISARIALPMFFQDILVLNDFICCCGRKCRNVSTGDCSKLYFQMLLDLVVKSAEGQPSWTFESVLLKVKPLYFPCLFGINALKKVQTILLSSFLQSKYLVLISPLGKQPPTNLKTILSKFYVPSSEMQLPRISCASPDYWG